MSDKIQINLEEGDGLYIRRLEPQNWGDGPVHFDDTNAPCSQEKQALVTKELNMLWRWRSMHHPMWTMVDTLPNCSESPITKFQPS